MFRKIIFSRAILLMVSAILFFSTANIWTNNLLPGFGLKTSANLKNLDDDELEIFALINRERRKKGLSDLEWDGRLARLARNYSKKMEKESFFDHFDQQGKSVVERAADAKIRGWRKIGENLFFSENMGISPAFAVRGWMNSTEHRRNILDRNFTTTGIGIAQSRDGRVFITQVFVQD